METDLWIKMIKKAANHKFSRCDNNKKRGGGNTTYKNNVPHSQPAPVTQKKTHE